MAENKNASGKNSEPAENLISEILKMDRVLYLRIIQEKETLTSLQMTREVLALKSNLAPDQITDKKINKNNPNINKRLKELADLGILNDYEGSYSLSSIGSLIVDDLTRLRSNIKVLMKHKDFFDSHSYSAIPLEQFREIYNLQFADQCVDAIDYNKEIERNTSLVGHEIRIVTERLHDIPGWIMEELKKGTLTLRLVYQFEELFKINSTDREELELWKDLTEEAFPSVKLRYMTLEDKDLIGIRIVDKKWALLNLSTLKDKKPDRSTSFYGKDKRFVNWIEGIFSNVWHISKTLNSDKIFEMESQ